MRITTKQKRAVAVAGLVFIAVVPSAAVSLRQAADQNAQQAAQRREGQLIERKICTDVGTMASIKPPSGSATANPSRAYEQAEHRAWSLLAEDLGCKR